MTNILDYLIPLAGLLGVALACSAFSRGREFSFSFNIFLLSLSIGIGVLIWMGVFPIHLIIISIVILVGIWFSPSGDSITTTGAE
jgi:hypothetical protein